MRFASCAEANLIIGKVRAVVLSPGRHAGGPLVRFEFFDISPSAKPHGSVERQFVSSRLTASPRYLFDRNANVFIRAKRGRDFAAQPPD
ncbi:hypothetical protein [Paraburkholderia acidisoli]|uniref:Uncharacterized protein n=1 Tax=Paraburkholderia acidisoli TaxID=2571748 RepID=A0A7Z2JG69_9BURK|nr:hypothetical protein [Paraburkholderia acidisoli]QGZ62214.1 hypothetical protein FAZ98_11010 [Paraburkholderia acidisoli]